MQRSRKYRPFKRKISHTKMIETRFIYDWSTALIKAVCSYVQVNA